MLAAGLVISSLILGFFYYSSQQAATKDILSVTGSAKTKIVSDQSKLILSIFRTVPTSSLVSGYSNVARDLSLTKTLLKNGGVKDEDIIESAVSMNQSYDYDNSGGETRYQLDQTLTVQSNDIDKLTAISKKIPSLAGQGAIVAIQSLEYYYSKLPELRVSLLADAIKDAKARAQKIAEGTGRKIGNVQSASSGVVQVLSVNSVEISDYGAYDTTSIEKDVMVSVKASFRLR